MTRPTTDSETTQTSGDYYPVWGDRRGQDLRQMAKQMLQNKEDRIVKVLEYQRNSTGVVSPGFCFDSADHAASWRRFLTNHIMFLQRALRIVPESHKIHAEVARLELRFQEYIEAVEIVLNEWFGALGHQGPDMREQVKGLVMMDSGLCAPHQDLLSLHNDLRRRLKAQYPALRSRNRDMD